MLASGPVAAVRAFNRFYTRQIGVLGEHLLDSDFSLTEMRVLYELAHRPQSTATAICEDLQLDPGYLSRILRRFESRRLIRREPAPDDARQSLLRLTAHGRSVFGPLEARTSEQVAAMLGHLSHDEQWELVAGMENIERLLTSPNLGTQAILLRPHRPGDMGWVVHRHGALYAEEWGYSDEFESLVASIVSEFLANFDPPREHCWMAEYRGQIVGSVFLVKKSQTVAKLRLLLVEPHARGLGIGRQLVDACVDFARQVGYRKITLWTQSHLDGARRLYQSAGFERVHQEKHHRFGKDLVAETWELKLPARKTEKIRS
jgi:DNA-binding MarR family transcriptional regulator/GNAT superfamily N-acetyltransferase